MALNAIIMMRHALTLYSRPVQGMAIALGSAMCCVYMLLHRLLKLESSELELYRTINIFR
jgi:hypothetical protein